MSKKHLRAPLAMAIGTVLLGSVTLSNVARAEQNPFGVTELSSGYMQLAEAKAEGTEKAKEEGKCGEGKCGADKKKKDGKCGEGKCGADKKDK